LSLHPKFYSPIFFWDVESSSKYAKKLKLTGIAATTLSERRPMHLVALSSALATSV
jgi:hypothetical protein